jgi:hypothetical protein
MASLAPVFVHASAMLLRDNDCRHRQAVFGVDIRAQMVESLIPDAAFGPSGESRLRDP